MFWNNPQNKDPERASSLQRYLVLHSRQETLRRQSQSSRSPSTSSLPQSRPSLERSRSSMNSSSSSVSSPEPQPLMSPSLSPAPPYMPAVTEEPEPLDPKQDSSTGLPDNDELHENCLEIKATLTRLLNCESVRHDSNFRTWVQSRLMDAESELKNFRKSSLSRSNSS